MFKVAVIDDLGDRLLFHIDVLKVSEKIIEKAKRFDNKEDFSERFYCTVGLDSVSWYVVEGEFGSHLYYSDINGNSIYIDNFEFSIDEKQELYETCLKALTEKY